MLMLDATSLLTLLPYSVLVDELADKHREPEGLVDELLIQSIDSNQNENQFFIRAGWQTEEALGAKVITVFPRNNIDAIKPSIQAVYILFEAKTGSPIACMDGTVLTYLKTAADSALGSRFLSRPDSKTLLMIGAGAMAEHLIEAHCAIRPGIEQVFIWNRTPQKAISLCEQMVNKFSTKIRFNQVDNIDSVASQSDIICSATASVKPLLEGRWLRPGTHLDLVGSYRPDMREVDDDCLSRGRIFVDARGTTIHRVGELMIPLSSGVISESDIIADLRGLCYGHCGARENSDEITIFKNGGGGHLDLMTAQILYQRYQSKHDIKD
ncbi:MAG: alanine dehydrogenase [Gammaproteobacteria bacterium]|jgi:alanine dehydrogenase